VSDDQVDHLKKYIEEMSGAVHPFDTSRFLQAHVAFHLGIVDLSGSYRLQQQEAVFRISGQMLYRRLADNEERMERSNIEHGEILDAILSGDADLAEASRASTSGGLPPPGRPEPPAHTRT